MNLKPAIDLSFKQRAAGDSSQQGILMLLMPHSLVDCDSYDEAIFSRRLDDELFPKLDGTPVSGPAGYTSQSISDAWNTRVRDGRSWDDVAGQSDQQPHRSFRRPP